MKLLIKLFGRGPRGSTAPASSKTVAKERLQLALTYDRGGLAHSTIEQLRDEIIKLIAKHLAVHEEDIIIDFDRTLDRDKMIASIPIQTAKRPRGEVARVTGGEDAGENRRKNTRENTHKNTHRPRQRRRRRAAN